MPRTLVLLVHPEQRSFNGAWAEASARASAELGHEVLRSDLYRQGFDPAEGLAHYPGWSGVFDPLKAQDLRRPDEVPGDLADEIAKLQAADRLIIHFPMWWFGPPAMLKGWCDRVLTHGLIHDVENRFDTGRFSGLEVLFCVTTGADDIESGPAGKEGNWQMLLWPLAQTFRYIGARVKQPLAVHGVHGYHRGARAIALQERLSATLAEQTAVLASWSDRPAIPFNPESDFDRSGKLKSDAPSHTPFIRHAEDQSG